MLQRKTHHERAIRWARLNAASVAAGVFYPITQVGMPPQMAGLLMAFSSVSVVASSLMLKRYKRMDLTNASIRLSNRNKSCVDKIDLNHCCSLFLGNKSGRNPLRYDQLAIERKDSIMADDYDDDEKETAVDIELVDFSIPSSPVQSKSSDKLLSHV